MMVSWLLAETKSRNFLMKPDGGRQAGCLVKAQRLMRVFFSFCVFFCHRQ